MNIPQSASASTRAVIVLEAVSKRYGNVQALQDVSIQIAPGVTGLLGPNGAGKTTLIKILLGVIGMTEGRVEILGEELRRGRTQYRRQLGYVPEDDCYLSGLTGVESVFFAARMSGLPPKEGLRRSHEILDFCGVQQERYRAVETYSTGMRQKIRFASAIVHDPPLMILDEPTSGLDPEERDAMLHRINLLAREYGKSIVISTHILPDVQAVCDHVVVLGQGQVIGSGELQELLSPTSQAWRVECDGAAERLAEALIGRGLEGIEQTDRSLVIPRGSIESHELFAIARELGVTIRQLKASRRSLEQYFLDAVESQQHGAS